MITQSIFQIDLFHWFQNDSSHWYQIQLGYTHIQQVRKIVRRVVKHLKFNIREIAYSSTVRDAHGGTLIPRIIANMKRWVLNDTIMINSISHRTLSRWHNYHKLNITSYSFSLTQLYINSISHRTLSRWHNYDKLNITSYSFSLNLGSVFLVLILDWFFSSTFYSGDALFFHSNLLHCSGQNSSPNRRWAFLTAYNTVSNRKCKPHHHPDYQPLEKVRKS